MLEKVNTSYNKANIQIVATFIGVAAVWVLNTKFNAGIPDWLSQSGQGALGVILCWIVPNAEA